MNLKSDLHKIFIIANYTLKDVLKSRLLLNVLLIGVGLVVITLVATEFTYGVPERVAVDFGLGCLTLSCNTISLLLGLGLIAKEIDSRTVYMVISRPVPRYAFLIGKISGLAAAQVINVLLLSLMTISLVKVLGGELSTLFYWSIFFILLEAWLLLFVVVLLSLYANQILTFIGALVLLIAGHGISEAYSTTLVARNEFLKQALDVYSFILPGFYKLNLKDYVIYKQTLPWDYLFKSLIYFACYSIFLIYSSVITFNRKNLD